MNDKWHQKLLPPAMIVGLGIASISAILLIISLFVPVTGRPGTDRMCQDYCNCSVTKNCSYTFNYDDVKDCDCSK